MQNVHSGDATFHAPHGAQEIHVLVENSGGTVVASDVGVVSDSEEDAFSFSFDFANSL